MELTLISENKIKISLTKEDLDLYSITSEDIDYDNTETRMVFWTLLDKAKKTTGFDAAKSRIFIQIYTGRDGGCELYVSKMKSASDDGDGESLNTLRRIIKRREEKREKSYVFRFESVGEIIAACKRLKAFGVEKSSYAYCDEEKRFFLSLDRNEDSVPFIDEYGERLCGEEVTLYVKEHCKVICDGDAVERLWKM